MPDRPQQSYLGKILLIAWREFRYTALTKGFIIGAIALPIVMFGVVAVVPSLLSRESPPLVGSIAILDPTGTIIPRAKAILERPVSMIEAAREIAENPPVTATEQMEAVSSLPSATPQKIEVTWRAETDPAALDAIKSDLKTGKLIAGASVGADALDPSKPAKPFEFYIPSSLSPKHVTQISRAIRKAIEEERVARSGVDKALIARISDSPEPSTMRISPEGAVAKEITELRFMVPVAFMFLLWVTVFTSANYLLTTTIEEKSNKVMEVLLAAASPMQLLVGKILGYAAISAVMLVMYGGLGIAGLSAAAMLDLVPVMHLVYLVTFFVMGYIMVAAMMSAVGSAVSDLREAQSLVGPVMMVLIVPVMLWLPIVENPNGTLATVASYIPPATPFVMIMRLTAATEPIPLWQTVSATLWGFVCAFGLMWLAARIFRVGVLMQGKPPTPRELIRWAFVR
jgi:ABC-2 type transport system permease protein